MRSCWNLKLSSLAFIYLFPFFYGELTAQFSNDKPLPAPSTDKRDYLFPIRPGTTSIITGTMGELRNTHFHAGLDINTSGIGVPVQAVQNGYISRIGVSTSGYGNVLYISHPDGHTTVYAHLEEFKGAIADHVRKARYAKKVSEINLYPKANQFPVSRGEVIALSGNTGGSGGPHLHFEVRDKNNEAINPLVYGFSEVKDNRAPTVFKIALKTMDEHARINDQFGRFEFSVVKEGDTYSLPNPILAFGNIGVEVLAHDVMENSRFRYGINHIDLLANDQKIFQQRITKVNFNDSRKILTLMDFNVLQLQGNRFNKLYIDDGNTLDYFPGVARKKSIAVKDTDVPIRISLKDFNENESIVNFTLKANPVVEETPILSPLSKPLTVDIQENILRIELKECGRDSLELWSQGKSKIMTPRYRGSNQVVFLIDLQKDLPDSLVTCQGSTPFDFKDRIPSETIYNYYSELVDIEFPKGALYDTAFLAIRYDTLNKQEIFTIGDRTIPLHRNIHVTLKPVLAYTQTKDQGLYRKVGKGHAYVSSEWKNNKLSFSTRDFGAFTLLRDTVPPSITKISLNTVSARFKISDNLSGVSYFEANINGQWLLMNYDYKTGILKSERPDEKPLQGDFELKVVDQAGNKRVFKQKIP